MLELEASRLELKASRLELKASRPELDAAMLELEAAVRELEAAVGLRAVGDSWARRSSHMLAICLVLGPMFLRVPEELLATWVLGVIGSVTAERL